MNKSAYFLFELNEKKGGLRGFKGILRGFQELFKADFCLINSFLKNTTLHMFISHFLELNPTIYFSFELKEKKGCLQGISGDPYVLFLATKLFN